MYVCMNVSMYVCVCMFDGVYVGICVCITYIHDLHAGCGKGYRYEKGVRKGGTGRQLFVSLTVYSNTK